MNSIEAKDLPYPDKPDRDGRAKKYYQRRAYYFGEHNTPESFELFGAWKRSLVETGVPTDVKDIRLQVAARKDPALLYRAPHWSFAGIAVAFFVGALCSAFVNRVSQGDTPPERYSAAKPVVSQTALAPSLDGKVLTEYELELVRGSRDFEARTARLLDTRASRVVQRNAFTEELPDGPFSFKEKNGP